MLDLVGVSKTFGRSASLCPIDLKLPPGRTTVLLGPSGCGKSLLRFGKEPRAKDDGKRRRAKNNWKNCPPAGHLFCDGPTAEELPK
jgi:ABC-type transporter Mla maintaining outer membrane lipid asymmetry ATPase subunit MlaF